MILKRASIDTKVLAVKFYLNVKSFKIACSIFNCSKSSLWRWTQLFKTNNVIKYNTNRKSYKVTQSIVDSIINSIRENCDITLEEIKKNINRSYDVELSIQHISRIIKDNNYSLKKKFYRHYPILCRNIPINHNERTSAFSRYMLNVDLTKIIAIDETGVYPNMSRKYGRELIGKRLIQKSYYLDRFKQKTLLVAISTQGVEKRKLYDTGTKSNDIVLFLKELLKNKEGYTIIMDNTASHKTKEVKDIIETTNNILKYTPPYSPQYNPIEEYFSQLKSYIRKHKSQTYEELNKAIEDSIKTTMDINSFYNYFIHAYRRSGKIKKHRFKRIKIYKNE